MGNNKLNSTQLQTRSKCMKLYSNDIDYVSQGVWRVKESCSALVDTLFINSTSFTL